MNRVKYLVGIIALSLIVSGCTGYKIAEKHTEAVKLNQSVRPENYSLIYSLPSTNITVEATVIQTIVKRGPYYQFAERYLGIQNVPDQDSELWQIEMVDISSSIESDPEHFYVLTTNDTYITNFLKLKQEGFIIPFTEIYSTPSVNLLNTGIDLVSEPLFTDTSIHPHVVEETRTVMRTVRQDNSFVNVPVLQRESVTKSLEARAAEVADLIFELRSNRFKLMSGDLDLFPDGKAMEEIIREFARIEKEYLALFTGKTLTQSYNYSFNFKPKKSELDDGIERVILFNFSDTEGILPIDNRNGRPVIIEFESEMKTSQLNFHSQRSSAEVTQSTGGHLYYRIPDMAAVRIIDRNRTISAKRLPVSQYGTIISLPANFYREE